MRLTDGQNRLFPPYFCHCKNMLISTVSYASFLLLLSFVSFRDALSVVPSGKPTLTMLPFLPKHRQGQQSQWHVLLYHCFVEFRSCTRQLEAPESNLVIIRGSFLQHWTPWTRLTCHISVCVSKVLQQLVRVFGSDQYGDVVCYLDEKVIFYSHSLAECHIWNGRFSSPCDNRWIIVHSQSVKSFVIGRLLVSTSIWSNSPFLSVHSLSSGKYAFLGQGLEVSWLVLEEDGQRLDQDLPARAGEQWCKDRLGSVRLLLIANSSSKSCVIRLDSCKRIIIYFFFHSKKRLVAVTSSVVIHHATL